MLICHSHRLTPSVVRKLVSRRLFCSIVPILAWVPVCAAAQDATSQAAAGLRHKNSPWVQQHYRSIQNDADILSFSVANVGTAPTVPSFKGNVTTFQPLSAGTYQALLRASNCSLSLLTFSYSPATLVSKTPGYQDTLHRLAQLTSTPDKFKGGCTDPIRGEMAHFGTIIGKTSKGEYIGAVGQLNGLETAITTYIADTATGKMISATNKVGPNAGLISVADLNGDGYNDMVVPFEANGANGSIAVLLGNPNGSFKPAIKYALPFVPEAVTLNDFNGDGKVDIAAVGETLAGKPEVAVLLNKGNGSFRAAKTTSAPTNGYFLVSADFNGDKKADLTWGDGTILLGNGDGTFKVSPHRWSENLAGPAYFNGLVARDFNHDGKVDIAAVTEVGQSVVILTGNGNGTFTPKAAYSSIFGVYELTASDLDGDGNEDLVLGEYGDGGFSLGTDSVGSFQVLMGNGDGTFQGAPLYPGFGMTQTAGVRSFAYGDLTGDGKVDLLGQSASISDTTQKSLSVLKGNGFGKFAQGPVSPLQSPDEFDVHAADMRGNGKLDALTIGSTSATDTTPALHVYFAKGGGSFEIGSAYTLPGQPSNFAVADINGDGKPDVVVLIVGVNQFGETVPGKPGLYELLNKGDGTLKPAKLIDGKVKAGSTLVLASLGNGQTDIVVQQNGNQYAAPPVPGDVLVYLGRGNGTFLPAVQYLPDTFGGGALAVANVLAKGKPDIVTTVASYDSKTKSLNDSRLVVLPNKGDGTFGKAISTPQADRVPSLTDIAVADFNGDGKLDVVQGDCCGLANTYIFFGKGDGTFQAPMTLAIGASSTSVTAVNLTGAKYPDLVLASSANELGSDVVVLQNLYGANLPAPDDMGLLGPAPPADATSSDSEGAAKAPQSETAKSIASTNARLR